MAEPREHSRRRCPCNICLPAIAETDTEPGACSYSAQRHDCIQIELKHNPIPSPMKTKIALGAIAMSIASFTAPALPKNPAAEEAGKKIFAAFQHSAFMEYNSMVPSLTDLYQMMEANASFYGSNL